MVTKEAVELIKNAAHQGIESLLGPVDLLDGILDDDLLEQINSALGCLIKIEQVAVGQLGEPDQEG